MQNTNAEPGRLAALHGYSILDTPPEPEFDDIVRQAARLLGAPIALISLIDERRQWFKARIGLSVQETPRSLAFCAHAIAGDEVMIVDDASKDPRFMNSPLVLFDPSIRFYAGAVLEDRGGHRLGTICVIDQQPRAGLRPDQIATLQGLGKLVIDVIEQRQRKLRDLASLDDHQRPQLRG